jgi:hypothetical protein
MIFASFVHEVPGRRPIAVAIEQRTDNFPVQDIGKSFELPLRFPFRNHFVPTWKASDP